jgi:uncharacterized membrane protein YdfJ with MMPL/SSD domain
VAAGAAVAAVAAAAVVVVAAWSSSLLPQEDATNTMANARATGLQLHMLDFLTFLPLPYTVAVYVF